MVSTGRLARLLAGLGLTLLLALGAAAGCGSDVAMSSQGGGAGGTPPEEPPDICSGFSGLMSWQSHPCCGVDGCMLAGQECISADRLCYFDGCGYGDPKPPPFEAPCPPGYTCVIGYANSVPDDCDGGELCASRRGFCRWARE